MGSWPRARLAPQLLGFTRFPKHSSIHPPYSTSYPEYSNYKSFKMQESVDMKSLPTVQELKDKAAAGHQFTREEVRNLVEAEMMATGAPGPIRKGPAATIQSLYDAQQHFADKAEEMVGKPESEIRRHDARELHSAESRALGGHQPPRGSLSSEAQHIVDTRDDD